MANFVKKNPFDLNIFLSHMKYGRKIIANIFIFVFIDFDFNQLITLNEFGTWTSWTSVRNLVEPAMIWSVRN